jgi:hypothetical protein
MVPESVFGNYPEGEFGKKVFWASGFGLHTAHKALHAGEKNGFAVFYPLG